MPFVLKDSVTQQANSSLTNATGHWQTTLLVLLLFVALSGCGGNESVSASDAELDVATPTVAPIVLATPTPLETLMPTDLPLTEEAAPPIVTILLATREPTPIPTEPPQLPTLTPTSPPPPAAQRNVEISGSTLMRLALSGEGFDSTGKPHSYIIEPRRLVIGGDGNTAADDWCIQLGLVNETFDLAMQLDPYTDELIVSGTISLRQGFCGATGDEMDSVAVELVIPVGAAAQISYNLQGKRSLFGVSGLLDSDTGAIVELRITNSNPE